jgi:hypothetical protein
MIVQEVEPPVEGGDALVQNVLKHRKLQEVHVEVDDVKLISSTSDLVQHDKLIRCVISNSGEAKGCGDARDEFPERAGVATGEQRDLMSLSDKFLRQP